MNSSFIRQEFLKFFEKNGHDVLPSASLLPDNDPSLLFTNSGMVPFKTYFLGERIPPNRRIASSQRCIRAGGKHNDLDNVGYTRRHHTFFEMLGNFSFADYFKKEAIAWAWELITQHFQIDKNRLYITYYAEDSETCAIWKKITNFSDERIIPIDNDDNFWRMGALGPCGPCSEIFYDLGPQLEGSLPGTEHADGDRFMEIWNIVFTSFTQISSDKMVPIPTPCIDTGMGLERISCVLQDKLSNYETDLFRPVIDAASMIFGPDYRNKKYTNAYNVLSDHIRAAGFLIAEGLLPSREGQGYVLRRIIRRAIRYAQMINPAHTFSELIPAFVKNAQEIMELPEQHIRTVIEEEENDFSEVLQRGIHLLEKEKEKMGSQRILSGSVAFTLYDTYGFPFDLTKDILRQDGYEVDENEFHTQMAIQKKRSQDSRDDNELMQKIMIGMSTLESFEETQFLGYEASTCTATVKVLLDEDFQNVLSLEKGKIGYFIPDITVLYATSGGQVHDEGEIYQDQTRIAGVDHVLNRGHSFIHHLTNLEHPLKVGDTVTLVYAPYRRQALRRAHTATHLLHAALQKILGVNATQKGSLVEVDSVRFDFFSPDSLKDEQLNTIEALVNLWILKNAQVHTKILPYKEALEKGGIALFGEKYGDYVRLVSIFCDDNQQILSSELCGGTHVAYTGEIGVFYIIRDLTVGAQIKRIEACVGEKAYIQMQKDKALLNTTARVLSIAKENIVTHLEKLKIENKELQKELSQIKRENLRPLCHAVQGINVHLFLLEDDESMMMKQIVTKHSKREKNTITVGAVKNNEKITLLMNISEDLQNLYSAKDLLLSLALDIDSNSKGGGGSSFAQASCVSMQNFSDLEQIILGACLPYIKG